MTVLIPTHVVSEETHGQTGQSEAGVGLRDTVGLDHIEFRKRSKIERKKYPTRDPAVKLFEVCVGQSAKNVIGTCSHYTILSAFVNVSKFLQYILKTDE